MLYGRNFLRRSENFWQEWLMFSTLKLLCSEEAFQEHLNCL